MKIRKAQIEDIGQIIDLSKMFEKEDLTYGLKANSFHDVTQMMDGYLLVVSV